MQKTSSSIGCQDWKMDQNFWNTLNICIVFYRAIMLHKIEGPEVFVDFYKMDRKNEEIQRILGKFVGQTEKKDHF
jgi:hypothetical protein